MFDLSSEREQKRRAKEEKEKLNFLSEIWSQADDAQINFKIVCFQGTTKKGQTGKYRKIKVDKITPTEEIQHELNKT